MLDYLVTNTDGGANLRTEPNTTSAYKNLPFATGLRLLHATGTKWLYVETEAGDRGYVSDKNLTKPASDAVVRLIQSAAHYWQTFNFGQGTEDKSPYYEEVVQMWTDLAQGMPPKKTIVGNNGVKKEVYNTSHPDWPWSAAGMSAFIRRAGGYTGFKYALKHSKYIHQSIALKNDQDAPFWGHKLSDGPVRVGDLVCQWRGSKQTFESASTDDDFTSHTDVICDIKGSYLYAIGANNQTDTVGRKKYSIDGTGRLIGKGGAFGSDQTVFMFMRNNAV